jgi:hypothetical protein
MKDEILIPVLKEEDFVAANLRRDKYAQSRDLLAAESNKAIITRLLTLSRNQIKCDKCGKEFDAGLNSGGSQTCSDCK